MESGLLGGIFGGATITDYILCFVLCGLSSSCSAIGSGVCNLSRRRQLILEEYYEQIGSGGDKDGHNNRMLVAGDDTMSLYDHCVNVEYNMNLILMKPMGHLVLYADPTTTTAGEGQEEDNLCRRFLAHVDLYPNEKDGGHHVEKEIVWFPKLIEKNVPHHLFQDPVDVTNDWDVDVDMQLAFYDMNVIRTFGDIMMAINHITVNDDEIDINSEGQKTTASYMEYENGTPTNCASFLLEVGKQLSIPVDKELMHFVVTNMDGTTFHKYIANEDSAIPDSKKEGMSGMDQTILHHLGHYMLQQQYPTSLIRV